MVIGSIENWHRFQYNTPPGKPTNMFTHTHTASLIRLTHFHSQDTYFLLYIGHFVLRQVSNIHPVVCFSPFWSFQLVSVKKSDYELNIKDGKRMKRLDFLNMRGRSLNWFLTELSNSSVKVKGNYRIFDFLIWCMHMRTCVTMHAHHHRAALYGGVYITRDILSAA